MFTQSEQEDINPERKTGDGWCDEVKEWEDGERVKSYRSTAGNRKDVAL